MVEPDGQQLVRDGFLPAVLGPVGVALGIDQPERRMPLVASQIIGLIIVRYVARGRAAGLAWPTELVAASTRRRCSGISTVPLP